MYLVSVMFINILGLVKINILGSIFFSVCYFIENDDLKINVGRKYVNNMCGLILFYVFSDVFNSFKFV